MKNQRLKNRIIKLLLISGLVVFPLSIKAFFLEDIFDDFGYWFKDEKEIKEQLSYDLLKGDGYSVSSSETQVINNVEIYANSGGNTANAGEGGADGSVIEGESKSKIFVQNIINGTEIEPVNIESSSSQVIFKEKIEAKDDKATVERETQIGSEKTEESYEIDLQDTDSCNETGCEEEILAGIEGVQEEANEESIINGEKINNQETLENKKLSFVEKLYLGFVENLKSFFQNIINKII